MIEELERDRKKVPFHVTVNPTLTLVGDETVEAFEDCISFDDFSMIVRRPEHVKVEAWNERGDPISIEVNGLVRTDPPAGDR